MTSGRPQRVDVDAAATLAEALAAMQIAADEFLWMVRCDDPPQLSDPPPWWFLLLYYLMQRCAGPRFSEELRRRVNILSQRYYARAWKIANNHRATPKKPGIGGSAERYSTAHGDLSIPEAAALLGLNPSTLHRRMAHGLTLDQAMQKKKGAHGRHSVLPVHNPVDNS